MRIIDTSTIDIRSLSPSEKLWVYNGIDSPITLEIYQKLPQKENLVYNFELALQAPLLEMTMRGILVDQEAREKARVEVLSKIVEYEKLLDYFGEAFNIPPIKTKVKRLPGEHVPKYLNAASGDSLKKLFYDFLGIPPIKK